MAFHFSHCAALVRAVCGRGITLSQRTAHWCNGLERIDTELPRVGAAVVKWLKRIFAEMSWVGLPQRKRRHVHDSTRPSHSRIRVAKKRATFIDCNNKLQLPFFCWRGEPFWLIDAEEKRASVETKVAVFCDLLGRTVNDAHFAVRLKYRLGFLQITVDKS